MFDIPSTNVVTNVQMYGFLCVSCIYVLDIFDTGPNPTRHMDGPDLRPILVKKSGYDISVVVIAQFLVTPLV